MKMTLNRIATAAIVLTFVAEIATAQTTMLPTYTGGSGSNAGIMFDLTAKAPQGIFVRKIETLTEFALNIDPTFQVYTREGTYVGHDMSSAGWTLVSELTIPDSLPDTYYDLEVPQVVLDFGETLGVFIDVINYIHQGDPQFVPGVGLSLIPPALPLYEDNNVRLTGGTRKLAAHLAGGNPFGSPSDPNFQWKGRVTTAPVPEPATWIALTGFLGSLALLRRRK